MGVETTLYGRAASSCNARESSLRIAWSGAARDPITLSTGTAFFLDSTNRSTELFGELILLPWSCPPMKITFKPIIAPICLTHFEIFTSRKNRCIVHSLRVSRPCAPHTLNRIAYLVVEVHASDRVNSAQCWCNHGHENPE